MQPEYMLQDTTASQVIYGINSLCTARFWFMAGWTEAHFRYKPYSGTVVTEHLVHGRDRILNFVVESPMTWPLGQTDHPLLIIEIQVKHTYQSMLWINLKSYTQLWSLAMDLWRSSSSQTFFKVKIFIEINLLADHNTCNICSCLNLLWRPMSPLLYQYYISFSTCCFYWL